MRVHSTSLFISLLISTRMPLFGQANVLNGTIRDAETRQPIAYSSITVLETGQGLTSNAKGNFAITLKNGLQPALIAISSVGYITDTVRLTAAEGMGTFFLKPAPGVLNDIVISAASKATRIRENPLAVGTVSRRQIEQAAENNVIDAISKSAPGFETVKTGPNVSKPFINGLGYNRVLTLYDGMRVETQQWGDEHGVPVDDYIIARAEVIKGPASLLYGSDAIAGVLSLFPEIPRDTDNVIHGKYLTEYQTNNGLIGNSLQLMKGSRRWQWALRASERIARNYTNPVDGRVYNTDFKMENASGFLGYESKKGYSRLNSSFYNNLQGIPDGSRDSLTRKFTYQAYESAGENTILTQVDDIKNRPVVPDNVLNSYALSPLHQRIQDYRLYNDNFYRLGEGDIRIFVGTEQNRRREYDHPTDAAQAGEYIVLNTLNYGVRYNAPTFYNTETSFGVNGMYQTNRNLNATDFPIPDYHLFDAGVFGYAKWKYDRWTIAGGVRYDQRNENGSAMYIKANPATGFFEQVPVTDSAGGTKQFSPFRLVFSGVTGSIGATYQLSSQLSVKANIARGYRSPNITEIASNGLDPGAHIVYLGNLNFVPEFSLQEDAGIIGDFQNISFGVSAFNNNIQHYIYEAQKVDAAGNPVVIVPGNKTFQFQQTNALLYGMDATVNINHAGINGLSLASTFSFVHGFNLNVTYKHTGVNGEYLPFIPPPRLLSSAAYNIKSNIRQMRVITVKAEADYNAAQNHYLGLYDTETPTGAYFLLNAGVHTELSYGKKQLLQLQITINNVFNTAYQNHLSRLQYFEYYASSPNGHLGIYNMGRNVCLKIIAPF